METVLGLLFILPVFGLLTMVVIPPEYQNVQGWLITSYLIIPGFLALIALAVNFPMLLFGGLLFAGFAAGRK